MLRLIINADDYGRSKEVDTAILEAYKKCIISDISCMVVCKDRFEKATSSEYANLFNYKMGLHLCITMGEPLTAPIGQNPIFCDDNGKFKSLEEINLPNYWLSSKMRRILLQEVFAQIEALQNRGISITHLDSHQHVHFRTSVLPIFVKACKKYKIRYLRYQDYNSAKTIVGKLLVFLSRLYIRINGIKITNYFGYYANFKSNFKKNGVGELMCHPVLNSKGEIINKIRGVDIENSELLKSHLCDLQRHMIIRYSDI